MTPKILSMCPIFAQPNMLNVNEDPTTKDRQSLNTMVPSTTNHVLRQLIGMTLRDCSARRSRRWR
eukprot:5976332-Heterocapsa_arctica.AAC.1